MNLRILLAAAALAAALPAPAADPNKVFRFAIEVAETSLDPQRVSDLYSNIIAGNIYDPPLRYDHLARPMKLQPNTLSALPEVTDGGRTFTLHVKPGIYFAPDPAFKGKKRELVAEDYVYSFKRLIDARLRSPLLAEIEELVIGASEAAEKSRKTNTFDYDAPIEGLRALDRYTLQIRLKEPSFIFIYNFADCRVSCAVARDVVEHYGDDLTNHPVGTGPYQVTAWKRASKITLEANPNYREEFFSSEAPPGDEEAAAVVAALKGKRLPIVGRVEVYVLEAVQPRWLAFLNEEHDLLWRIPEEYAYIAAPENKIAPNLKKRGIHMAQVPALDLTFNYFNMEDPIWGGYTPERVALRRAVSLGYKVSDEIAIVRKGQAIPAETPYSPGVAGYDPNFRTSAGEYNPAKAKALLDMFGYVDRDGDGYRDLPDGSPLVLKSNSTTIARDVQLDELWKRSMDEIGIRYTVRKAQWPDLLKESNAGKLQFWQLGGSASSPDADTWLQTYYGPNAGYKGNRSRFKLDAYDKLYEKARAMPDSPERTKLYQEMARLLVAYAPSKINTHRILTDFWHPWVSGFRRPPVQSQPWWKFIDIDLARAPAPH
ncbi:putative deoxycholate-binding periplasmic protein YgiS [Usitatibacter rugosus]|uniref:Putative deoxycholate-binding periplasmic protein YgiS n=1 Tax=Usitatibacter rugosus TaxID=2732067 RepID=A0A6M4GSF9_9PROT|nr:ABC transporter substrate-binding protein [Usitatibacter rugosus]QJR09404.1 putative deoxycholate-binding periplasmic protein YgiS [Usitatibacter rugosus]